MTKLSIDLQGTSIVTGSKPDCSRRVPLRTLKLPEPRLGINRGRSPTMTLAIAIAHEEEELSAQLAAHSVAYLLGLLMGGTLDEWRHLEVDRSFDLVLERQPRPLERLAVCLEPPPPSARIAHARLYRGMGGVIRIERLRSSLKGRISTGRAPRHAHQERPAVLGPRADTRPRGVDAPAVMKVTRLLPTSARRRISEPLTPRAHLYQPCVTCAIMQPWDYHFNLHRGI